MTTLTQERGSLVSSLEPPEAPVRVCLLLVDSSRAHCAVLCMYSFPTQTSSSSSCPWFVLRSEFHKLITASRRSLDADRRAPNFPFVGKGVYKTETILHPQPFSGKDALMPTKYERHKTLNTVSFMQIPLHVLCFIWSCGHQKVSDLHSEPLSPWLPPHFFQESCLKLSGLNHILPSMGLLVHETELCITHTVTATVPPKGPAQLSTARCLTRIIPFYPHKPER